MLFLGGPLVRFEIVGSASRLLCELRSANSCSFTRDHYCSKAAGYCAWLNAAFGPYAAFVGSMLHYSGGLLDNSIYPVLFFSYLKAAELPGFPAEESGGLAELRLWVVLSFTAVGTWLTWRGLDVNGSACFYLTAVVLLPFLVFSILGLPQVTPES